MVPACAYLPAPLFYESALNRARCLASLLPPSTLNSAASELKVRAKLARLCLIETKFGDTNQRTLSCPPISPTPSRLRKAPKISRPPSPSRPCSPPDTPIPYTPSSISSLSRSQPASTVSRCQASIRFATVNAGQPSPAPFNPAVERRNAGRTATQRTWIRPRFDSSPLTKQLCRRPSHTVLTSVNPRRQHPSFARDLIVPFQYRALHLSDTCGIPPVAIIVTSR